MKKIGELAKQYQLKTDTLRYYEKQRLLTPSHRSASDYRFYTQNDEKRLRFILRSKKVGLSLEDIRELLRMDDQRSQWSCHDVKDLVESKAEQIQIQIDRLESFKDALDALGKNCCGGHERATNCSILDSLEHYDE